METTNTPAKHDTDIHIRVSSELLEKVKKKAKKARRTLPDFIRVTLEDTCDAER